MTLRASQLETLRVVRDLDGPSAGDLARETNRWEGAAKGTLDRLTDLGYLVCLEHRSPASGRTDFNYYVLTTKGRQALSEREANGG